VPPRRTIDMCVSIFFYHRFRPPQLDTKIFYKVKSTPSQNLRPLAGQDLISNKKYDIIRNRHDFLYGLIDFDKILVRWDFSFVQLTTALENQYVFTVAGIL
jgi:hypothetical protein